MVKGNVTKADALSAIADLIDDAREKQAAGERADQFVESLRGRDDVSPEVYTFMGHAVWEQRNRDKRGVRSRINWIVAQVLRTDER